MATCTREVVRLPVTRVPIVARQKHINQVCFISLATVLVRDGGIIEFTEEDLVVFTFRALEELQAPLCTGLKTAQRGLMLT